MQQTISITRKWQIHIPKAIRQQLDITKPTQVEIKTEDNRIIITPKRDSLLDYAGKYSKFSKGKNIDLDKIRDHIDYTEA